jgi:hypothetical protein
MIVVPVSNSVGFLDQFRLRVIKEHNDRPGTYNFTVCVKDLTDELVLTRNFVYNTDNDADEFVIDLGSLSSGLYKVDIFNYNGCFPPPGVLSFTYWLHRIMSGPVLSFEGWTAGGRLRAIIFYVFNNRLFWKYLNNVYDTVIPANVQVYIEAADEYGDGFVGSVSTSYYATVRPNTKVPFLASFKFRYENPVARDIVKSFSGLVWSMRSFYVNLVDNYTIELGIVKTEPGPKPVVILLLSAVILAIGWFAYDATIRWIQLEHRKLDNVAPLINMYNDAYSRFTNALNACGNDLNCIAQVEKLWYTVLQSISSNIWYLMGSAPLRCDGIRLGVVCVPWWVVGVAIFLAGLMVISVVRR